MISASLLLVAISLSEGGTSAPEALVLVPVCDDSPTVAPVLGRLSLALGQAGWRVVPHPDSGKVSRPCIDVTRQQAERLVREGQQLFEEQLRHDAARLKLEEAKRLFHDAGSLLGGRELYAEIEFYLGWIAFELNQPAVATRHFHRVHQVRGPWEPDAARFPPPVLKAFKGAREGGKEARLRSAVSVDSTPTASRVLVDGADRCSTPCEVQLTPGEHFLEVRQPGYRAHARLLTATGEPQRLAIALQADGREGLARAIASKLRGDITDELRELGGAAIALTPGKIDDAVEAYVLAPGQPPVLHHLALRPNDLAAGEAALLRALGAPARPPASSTSAAQDTAPTNAEPSLLRSLPRRWWFWAAIAGSAIAVGTVAAVTSRDELRVTVRP